ncbi:hypothetical protein [Pseudomonas fluorescens]|uniref:hypothetical protein n=1 Tax=Pseudomonas fluorescens TaxID=294 RepID=UPI001252465F|nr:hypothetical protein [Pseudomonas fluorescens]VVQ37009.1 hypothetical protein PS947_05403 [Pseudomonas fluorescens]
MTFTACFATPQMVQALALLAVEGNALVREKSRATLRRVLEKLPAGPWLPVLAGP